MEEMHRVRYGERARSFHALTRYTTLPKPRGIHQPGSSLNPVLLGFCGGFII